MDESTPDVPTSSDSQESGEGNDHILCASAESVSVGGVAPEAGDNVSAKVDGIVQHLSRTGDLVYIKVDKVNGQDVPQDSPESANSEPDGESALLSKAAAVDSQSYA